MPDLTQFANYVAAALLLATMAGPGVKPRTLAYEGPEGVASSLGKRIGGMVHAEAGRSGVRAILLASAEPLALARLPAA